MRYNTHAIILDFLSKWWACDLFRGIAKNVLLKFSMVFQRREKSRMQYFVWNKILVMGTSNLGWKSIIFPSYFHVLIWFVYNTPQKLTFFYDYFFLHQIICVWWNTILAIFLSLNQKINIDSNVWLIYIAREKKKSYVFRCANSVNGMSIRNVGDCAQSHAYLDQCVRVKIKIT